MNITICVKQMELNSEMKASVVRKFEKVNRFLNDESARLNVEIIRITGEHHKKGYIFDVETKLYLAGKVIKAGGGGENVLSACGKALKEVERQLEKVKTKSQANKRLNRRTVLEIKGKV